MTTEPDSPIDVTLGVLDGRWTPVILLQFLHGEHSRRELRAALPWIPDDVLSDRLNQLDLCGLLRYEELDGESPRGLYRLTHRGQALLPVLDAMWAWGIVS